MKSHILIPVVVCVGVVLLVVGYYFSRGPATVTLTLHDTPFRTYVADTAHLREVGLGGRRGLAENEAMLFVFDTPHRLGFWMKDMRFPIDILWLDSEKRVVMMLNDVRPDTYPRVFYGPETSKYVVEMVALNAGKIGIQVGDIAEWE